MSRAEAVDPDDDVNHDRWLVSYADFMTLLMAFFVVMYSISQVSEEKYRILTQTFNEAFNMRFVSSIGTQLISNRNKK